MEVICLHDEAFYELIENVVECLSEKHNVQLDKWITPERAMALLNIKSKTTLQKLRDEGQIIFTQPQKRIILYDYDSIIGYLDKHTKSSF